MMKQSSSAYDSGSRPTYIGDHQERWRGGAEVAHGLPRSVQYDGKENDRVIDASNRQKALPETQPEVKVKSVYGGDAMVLYMRVPLRLDGFFREIGDAWKLGDAPMTLKWVDDEGDPCTVSSQRELDEALRLYELNRDSELVVHVFEGVPALPGLPCHGEDKNVYRRGARRWKKFYRVNGHKFQAKRFNRRAQCFYCRDYIWGLGRQGYRCIECRLAVHKKCHKFVAKPCAEEAMTGGGRGLLPESSTVPSNMDSSVSGSVRNGVMAGLDNPVFAAGPEMSVEGSPAFNNTFGQEMGNGGTSGDSGGAPGFSLDHFNLLRVIGRGSYAKVVQVELKTTGQIYAMKIIKKEMFIDDEDIDWVQTEKSAFEVATNHPFLVGLHSCFQTPSRLFFVIEFVPGGDLMFHMQRKNRLPEEHARFYASEIILALHYLHSRGIIYRDLKLDNVLIDMEGHIKLTDYGMCKENIGPGDVTSTFCGTPNYIAPEILRGKEYGYSVDYWALGVLMFEMMAGRSPFDIYGINDNNPDANSEDYLFQLILEKQIRIPRTLSVKASAVLRGFLNKDPNQRLGCKTDIDEGLQDIKDHPYFRNVEWDLLEQKQVVPPYKPELRDERDLVNFDSQFTDEPTSLTPTDKQVLAKIDQSEFDGFEYINPLLMSREDTV